MNHIRKIKTLYFLSWDSFVTRTQSKTNDGLNFLPPTSRRRCITFPSFVAINNFAIAFSHFRAVKYKSGRGHDAAGGGGMFHFLQQFFPELRFDVCFDPHSFFFSQFPFSYFFQLRGLCFCLPLGGGGLEVMGPLHVNASQRHCRPFFPAAFCPPCEWIRSPLI